MNPENNDHQNSPPRSTENLDLLEKLNQRRYHVHQFLDDPELSKLYDHYPEHMSNAIVKVMSDRTRRGGAFNREMFLLCLTATKKRVKVRPPKLVPEANTGCSLVDGLLARCGSHSVHSQKLVAQGG